MSSEINIYTQAECHLCLDSKSATQNEELTSLTEGLC